MHVDMKQVQPGWDVIDRVGEKIGDASDVQSDYIVVTKGLIFLKDLFIPLDAVDRVDTNDHAVILNVQKGEIDEDRWSQAPAAGSHASTSGSRDRSFADGDYDDDTVLTVGEERIRAEKTRQKTGEVAVGKRVIEQQAEMDVPVTRDEVNVTRRRVDRPATGDEAFTEGEVRVPITSEEVSVTKEPRVVEEIVVSKRPVTETKRVSDTVRREEVVLDEAGDARVQTDAATTRRNTYARQTGDDDDVAGEAGGAAAGALGGAAVGGAVGGPPGAVVGGAIGAAGGAIAGDAVEDEIEDGDRG